jgi:hypothetical protein
LILAALWALWLLGGMPSFGEDTKTKYIHYLVAELNDPDPDVRRRAASQIRRPYPPWSSAYVLVVRLSIPDYGHFSPHFHLLTIQGINTSGSRCLVSTTPVFA